MGVCFPANIMNRTVKTKNKENYSTGDMYNMPKPKSKSSDKTTSNPEMKVLKLSSRRGAFLEYRCNSYKPERQRKSAILPREDETKFCFNKTALKLNSGKFIGKTGNIDDINIITIKVKAFQMNIPTDIWIERNKDEKKGEIIIKVKGDWGYVIKSNNQEKHIKKCPILLRVGENRNNYLIDYSEEGENDYFVLNPENSGSLFISMDLSETVEEKLILEGELEVTLEGRRKNVKIRSIEEVAKTLWDETFVEKLTKENDVRFLTKKEKNVLFYINLFVGNPQKFLDFFFIGDYSFKNEDEDFRLEENFFLANEDLTNFAKSSNEGVTLSIPINLKNRVKKFSILANTDLEIELISELIISKDYLWFIDPYYSYIGINVTKVSDKTKYDIVLVDSLV